jgi:hypothetical protein
MLNGGIGLAAATIACCAVGYKTVSIVEGQHKKMSDSVTEPIKTLKELPRGPVLLLSNTHINSFTLAYEVSKQLDSQPVTVASPHLSLDTLGTNNRRLAVNTIKANDRATHKIATTTGQLADSDNSNISTFKTEDIPRTYKYVIILLDKPTDNAALIEKYKVHIIDSGKILISEKNKDQVIHDVTSQPIL